MEKDKLTKLGMLLGTLATSVSDMLRQGVQNNAMIFLRVQHKETREALLYAIKRSFDLAVEIEAAMTLDDHQLADETCLDEIRQKLVKEMSSGAEEAIRLHVVDEFSKVAFIQEINAVFQSCLRSN